MDRDRREREASTGDRLAEALASAGIRLGEKLLERLLVDVLVPWLGRLLENEVEPDVALDDAVRIVTGVDEDCPGCSGEEKARAARIEIAQALQNRNGRTPSLRDVNVLLELAVQTATQRAPATAPNQ